MDQTKKIMRLGAYGVITEHSKLLVTQKKSGPYKGLWGLPGGAIEFGETPEYTLKREIQEETALFADRLRLLTVITSCCEYLRNDEIYQFHHIGIIYRVNSILHLPAIVPEEEMRWIPFQEIIPEELTPFAKQAYSEKLFWK